MAICSLHLPCPPDDPVRQADTTPGLTTLREDEALFRNSVYQFADREIRPAVREMDEQARIPRQLIDKLFELGVMGIEVPESQGGSGAGFFHAVLAVEALSRVDPSVAVLVDVQNTLVINALLKWASASLKQQYLPRLAAGTVGAYALSEAGSGSDAFALSTRASGTGDSFVLSGRKLWITNANEADVFIVFANADPDAGYTGSRRSSSSVDFRDSSLARRKTNWVFAPAAHASCCSKIAACRAATCSGTSARDTRSPSRRSTKGESASAHR